jgi:hypothetical protein
LCAFYTCTQGFCNGPWLVNPFLLHPLAGYWLLCGIGAWPSPDGVQEDQIGRSAKGRDHIFDASTTCVPA